MSRVWHAAPCIVVLRNQINAAYPNRSKASDGVIGDEAHAQTKSEHNPDADGTVRAFDITHDPGDGCDGNKIAAQLVSSRDSRILYVIWNRRICRSYAKPGIPAWSWAAYTGPDPHTNHVHLSVTVAGADITTPWRLIGGTAQQEEDDMTPEQARDLAYANEQLRDVATRVNGVAAAVKVLASSVSGTVRAQVDAALDATLTDSAFVDKIADAVVNELRDADGDGEFDPDAPFAEVDPEAIKAAVKAALKEGTE